MDWFALSVVLVLVAVAVMVGVALVYILRRMKDSERTSAELRQKLAQLQTSAEQESSPRQAENDRQVLLEIYHHQGLKQASISFGFSLLFACIGFCLIGGTFAFFVWRQDARMDAPRQALLNESTTIQEQQRENAARGRNLRDRRLTVLANPRSST